MKKRIFALRDAKSVFLSPIVEANAEIAIRGVENALRDKNSLLYTHAQDFDLWELGEIDLEDGIITPTVPIKLVASVASIKSKGE